MPILPRHPLIPSFLTGTAPGRARPPSLSIRRTRRGWVSVRWPLRARFRPKVTEVGLGLGTARAPAPVAAAEPPGDTGPAPASATPASDAPDSAGAKCGWGPGHARARHTRHTRQTRHRPLRPPSPLRPDPAPIGDGAGAGDDAVQDRHHRRAVTEIARAAPDAPAPVRPAEIDVADLRALSRPDRDRPAVTAPAQSAPRNPSSHVARCEATRPIGDRVAPDRTVAFPPSPPAATPPTRLGPRVEQPGFGPSALQWSAPTAEPATPSPAARFPGPGGARRSRPPRPAARRLLRIKPGPRVRWPAPRHRQRPRGSSSRSRSLPFGRAAIAGRRRSEPWIGRPPPKAPTPVAQARELVAPGRPLPVTEPAVMPAAPMLQSPPDTPLLTAQRRPAAYRSIPGHAGSPSVGARGTARARHPGRRLNPVPLPARRPPAPSSPPRASVGAAVAACTGPPWGPSIRANPRPRA